MKFRNMSLWRVVLPPPPMKCLNIYILIKCQRLLRMYKACGTKQVVHRSIIYTHFMYIWYVCLLCTYIACSIYRKCKNWCLLSKFMTNLFVFVFNFVLKDYGFSHFFWQLFELIGINSKYTEHVIIIGLSALF